jgi:L,D-transpeptidase YbiS
MSDGDAEIRIEISLAQQTLRLLSVKGLLKEYPVSSAKNGAGEIMDSECTPRGRHIIAEKIGEDCAINSVFVGRQATGEIYEPILRDNYPERDWILTRILWLRGIEPGRNMDGNVDSYERYIYIHGAPDDVDMTICGSRGCVRLGNEDVIDLFNRVSEGTAVTINED